MQRIDFLKKLSFTALLVAGIRMELSSEPSQGSTSNQNQQVDLLPTYPMDEAEKITEVIVTKVYKEGMELDTFLKLFAEELKTRFPFVENSKTSNYHSLYSVAVRSEILFRLIIILVEVWQNLCLQFGLEGYDQKEFESDSIQIQDWIESLGKEFKIGESPHFFLKTKGDWEWLPSKVQYLVPWFGTQKTESIQFFPLSLEVHQVWEDVSSFKNKLEYNQNIISEVLRILDILLFRLHMNRAIWHQYAVRFYYLNFVEKKYSNKQSKKNQKVQNRNTLDLFAIRFTSFESAIRTIQERAFHMQSGVYHAMNRQNQQMVVSSLVQVIGQISVVTGGDQDVCKRLRLANHYGGILSVSTAAMATESLPILEDALQILQKERKLYFPNGK
ncbi:hypothetical protein [Leptospira perdikensis]|uniref:Uncharacterized protein n=1 Tax=Leptospira perdikensis TaxID=2484948 RepID=A0A4R9JFR9_9LEPT|nr:hypothetical protein [Leptospira perdikensis]TGL40330.1 hypothetical protein EHQ49_09735 [Leptospira perdikensis]